MTENFRLALIAHHARKLAELMFEEGHIMLTNAPVRTRQWWLKTTRDVDCFNVRDLAVAIEEHLNLNSKETHE